MIDMPERDSPVILEMLSCDIPASTSVCKAVRIPSRTSSGRERGALCPVQSLKPASAPERCADSFGFGGFPSLYARFAWSAQYDLLPTTRRPQKWKPGSCGSPIGQQHMRAVSSISVAPAGRARLSGFFPIGDGLPSSLNRCALPMTALRENSSPKICAISLALLPLSQSSRNVATCSFVHVTERSSCLLPLNGTLGSEKQKTGRTSSPTFMTRPGHKCWACSFRENRGDR